MNQIYCVNSIYTDKNEAINCGEDAYVNYIF